MCEISLAFASEFDKTFNPIKCQLLCYGKFQNESFDFDGVVIWASDKATHLGHIIGPNVSENVMLNASATLTRNINFVLHSFRGLLVIAHMMLNSHFLNHTAPCIMEALYGM